MFIGSTSEHRGLVEINGYVQYLYSNYTQTSIPSIFVDNPLDFQIHYYYRFEALNLIFLYMFFNDSFQTINSTTCQTYDVKNTDCRESNGNITFKGISAPISVTIYWAYYVQSNANPCKNASIPVLTPFRYVINLNCK